VPANASPTVDFTTAKSSALLPRPWSRYFQRRGAVSMNGRKVAAAAAVVMGAMLFARTGQAQDKAAVERGMKVYVEQKCATCHSIEGKGKKTGPLDGVASKLSEGEIREWLVNAPAMTKKTQSKKKPVMKNYAKLPKEDIDGLVAYMMTLKKN
jgi:mono/diheme cytochrome c family protein